MTADRQALVPRKRSFPDLRVMLLYLLVLTFPFDIWPAFTVGKRGIKLFWIVGLLLVIVFSVAVVRGRQRVRMTLAGKAILAFNFIALISAVNLLKASTPQRIDFLTEWLQLILYTSLFFVITSLKLTNEQLSTLFKTWLGVGVALSLYGIYQTFARSLDLPLAYLPITNPSLPGSLTRSGPPIGSFYRASSIFTEPGFFASYLLSPLLFAVILWMLRKKNKYHFLRDHTVVLGVILTLYIAFLFAFSMAVYVVLAFVIVVAFFNRDLQKRVLRLIAAAFLILVVLSFGLKPVFKENFLTAVFERTKAHVISLPNPLQPVPSDSPYARTSLKNRVKRAREGLRVWFEHPVTGVGLNNFSYYFPEDVQGVIHSGSVQVLAELGVFGLVGFGLIFSSALILIKKSWPRLQNIPGYEFIVAFYYILWARVFHFIIAENWIRGTIWMDLAVAMLLLHWLNDKIEGDQNPASVPESRGQTAEINCSSGTN